MLYLILKLGISFISGQTFLNDGVRGWNKKADEQNLARPCLWNIFVFFVFLEGVDMDTFEIWYWRWMLKILWKKTNISQRWGLATDYHPLVIGVSSSSLNTSQGNIKTIWIIGSSIKRWGQKRKGMISK